MSGSVIPYSTMQKRLSSESVYIFTLDDPAAPHTYVATDAYCIRVGCDCQLVSLVIHSQPEDDTEAVPAPQCCFVHLETRALLSPQGELLEPPPESFLGLFQARALEDGLPLWRDHYEEAREYGRKFGWRHQDWSQLGPAELLAWQEIFPADAPTLLPSEGGQDILLVDQYCPSPTCNCQEVVLNFVSPDAQGNFGVESPQTAVRLPFRGLAVLEEGDLDPQRVRAMLEQLLNTPGTRARFRTRYQEIKKVGQDLATRFPTLAAAWTTTNGASSPERSSSSASGEPTQSAQGSGETASKGRGRNEACSCGSGRKFKRCCGK